MPKSLGQIHTVNYELAITDAQEFNQIDLSGELSKQLQLLSSLPLPEMRN